MNVFNNQAIGVGFGRMVLLVLLLAGSGVRAEIIGPGTRHGYVAGDESVEKLEVRHSMLGVRDTLVFYTFRDQQAVLRVRIDNTSTKFPVKAVLYRFAADVTAEGLKKWLNNQHSDALFADAPAPVATQEIPAASCAVESHRKTGRSKHPNGEFDNYQVKFRIGDFTPKGAPKLKGFTGEATVHVKAG